MSRIASMDNYKRIIITFTNNVNQILKQKIITDEDLRFGFCENLPISESKINCRICVCNYTELCQTCSKNNNSNNLMCDEVCDFNFDSNKKTSNTTNASSNNSANNSTDHNIVDDGNGNNSTTITTNNNSQEQIDPDPNPNVNDGGDDFDYLETWSPNSDLDWENLPEWSQLDSDDVYYAKFQYDRNKTDNDNRTYELYCKKCGYRLHSSDVSRLILNEVGNVGIILKRLHKISQPRCPNMNDENLPSLLSSFVDQL